MKPKVHVSSVFVVSGIGYITVFVSKEFDFGITLDLNQEIQKN